MNENLFASFTTPMIIGVPIVVLIIIFPSILFPSPNRLINNRLATVPAHRGMAIPKFIDSCVVGVNECGNRPKRLVEPINKINDISISAQVCPL